MLEWPWTTPFRAAYQRMNGKLGELVHRISRSFSGMLLEMALSKATPTFPFIPDERQRQAIEHVHGPMLVIAGAGTGKTTVLTKRIARLVREGHARPDEILAVTYTKNAAQEMRQRVQEELRGTSISGLRIATFHEYCNDLLRENGKQFEVVDD